jgi:excisionase family DNA binding protein
VCPSAAKFEMISEIVTRAEPGELPALAGELSRALASVLIRSAAQAEAVPSPSPRERSAEQLLTVQEAAARLGVAKAWLYRHAKSLPFRRKLGHRTLRFDAGALQRWLDVRSRQSDDSAGAHAPLRSRLTR